MKNYNPFKKQRVIAIPVGEEASWERELVLKRLRPPPKIWRAFWHAWLSSFRLIPNLFKHPELVRQIAPEIPPQSEEEWKPKVQNRWYL